MKKIIFSLGFLFVSLTCIHSQNGNDRNISISLLAGSSVGNGLGLELQYKFPNDSNLAIHAGGGIGIGISDNGSFTGWNAGLLYYILDEIYIDGQFGTIESDYDTDPFSSTYLDTKTTFGPSVLLGTDWIVAEFGGFDLGINLGAGASYVLNGFENSQENEKVKFAYDVGTVIRF